MASYLSSIQRMLDKLLELEFNHARVFISNYNFIKVMNEKDLAKAITFRKLHIKEYL